MNTDGTPDALDVLAIMFGGSNRFSSTRAQRKRAERRVQFNPDASVLYRGARHAEIPEATVEYFVCKLVFKHPTKDVDILEAAGLDDLKQRTVYQAVMRVNAKAAKGLKLEEDLLVRIRGKEQTALNERYF